MIQIFLCYARNDIAKVKRLHKRLSEAGFKPWMDKKDIVPGEKWELSIERAIRHSDFFIVCLSSNSVNRRGFIQREIKYALDIWKEMTDVDIYLIPVRMEDCEVPESLQSFQWLNLFEKDGWANLTQAIREGISRRGLQLKGGETLLRGTFEGSIRSSSHMLRSGSVSYYYFDINSLLVDSNVVTLITEKIIENIKRARKIIGGKVDRLAFVEGYADSVSTTGLMSLLIAKTGINAVIVHQDRKTGNKITPSGVIKQDTKLVIITGVVTSGFTLRYAVDLLKEQVNQRTFPVIAVVCSQHSVFKDLKIQGIELYPIFGPEEIAHMIDDQYGHKAPNTGST